MAGVSLLGDEMGGGMGHVAAVWQTKNLPSWNQAVGCLPFATSCKRCLPFNRVGSVDSIEPSAGASVGRIRRCGLELAEAFLEPVGHCLDSENTIFFDSYSRLTHKR